MAKLIYESPRTKHRSKPLRSAPIDEADEKSRAVLEGKHWQVVERIEDPAITEEAQLALAEAEEPAEGEKGEEKAKEKAKGK